MSLAGVSAIVAVAFVAFGERSSEQSFKNASEYRQQGEIAASLIELKNALRKNPQNADIRIALGQTYLRLRDFKNAEKELRLARSFGARPSEIFEPLARVWQLQGKYQQVLDEIAPDGLEGVVRADAYVARGRAYAGLAQPEKAQQAFGQALRAVPQHVEAWIETARIAIDTNQVDEANQALSRLRDLAPNNLEVKALQGDLYLKTGDYARAVTQYKKVLARLPGHVLTKVALATALVQLGSDDEAAQLLDDALQQAPNNFDANSLRAVLALNLEDYATALRRAEAALQSNAGHLPSLAIAGAAQFALGRLELAERNLNKVLARVPDHERANQILLKIGERRAVQTGGRSSALLIDDSSDPLTVASAIDPAISDPQAIKSGLSYLEASRKSIEPSETVARGTDNIAKTRQLFASDGVDEAIELLELQLADNPGVTQTRTLLGEAYLRRGSAEEAYRLVETQLNRRETNRDVLTIAAIASLVTNRPDPARLALKSLEELDPQAVEIEYLLAVAYDKLGNVQAYGDKLERSLAIDHDYAPAVAERARFALVQMRLEEAEGELQKLGELWPDRPEYYDLVAGLALLRDQASNAAHWYRQAFDAGPTTVRALRLAYAENRAGRAADSQAVLTHWLREQPDDMAVALVLANKYLTSEALVDAAELYSIILRRRPDHIIALNNLAWISSQLDDHEAAVKLALRGLELSPDNTRLMDTLADIYVTEGRNAEALPVLKRAVNLDQANPGLQVKLVRALDQLGRREEARDLLRKTLADYRDFPERDGAERLSAQLAQ